MADNFLKHTIFDNYEIVMRISGNCAMCCDFRLIELNDKCFGFRFYVNERISLHSGLDQYFTPSDVYQAIKIVKENGVDERNYSIIVVNSGLYKITLLNQAKVIAVSGSYNDLAQALDAKQNLSELLKGYTN